jgi:type II secretory pathway pseudopilin PulG
MAKLRSSRGLTLVEALITVMILALVSLAVATGLIVATRAQSESIFESESGLLANTINLALSDVLRYAESTGTDTFRSDNYSLGDDGHFYVDDDVDTEGSEDDFRLYLSNGVPLVEEYFGMRMTGWNIAYDGVGVFSGGYTLTGAEGAPPSRDFTFKFKTLITP